jgi:TP901 family phage tail tape measure protein
MNKAANDAVGGFSKLQASVVTFNQAMAAMGRVFGVVNRVFAETVGQFAEFETALIGVGKTTNLQGAELDALGNAFQRLSETLPKTAAELAGIGQTAGQLGVTGAANILKFTEVMAKLESASNLSGEAGATAIARILNITDGGVQNIERFGSAIVGLGNQFAATEAEIADVATDVARGLSVFDVSSANILGLSTALKAMGAQAQLSGSVLGRVFREIESAVRNGGDQLAALERITGESGEALRKQFGNDSVSVFVKFVNGLSKIQKSGRSVADAMSELNLNGDEVNKILPVMASRADLVGKALAVANQEFQKNTALNIESGRANEALAAEWSKLGNAIQNAASDLGETLSPALKSVIKSIKTGFIVAVAEMTRIWNAFTKAISSVDFGAIADSFTNFGTAISLVVTALAAPQLIAGLTAITTWAIATAAPMAVIAAKFALVAISITTVAASLDILTRNMGTFGKILANSFQGVAENLEAKFKELFSGVLIGARNALEAIQGIKFGGIGEFATKAVAEIDSELVKIGNSIDENDRKMEPLMDKFNSLVSDIDLGFIGTAFDQGAKFLNSFNKELDKTVTKTNKLGNTGDEPQKKAREIITDTQFKFPKLFDAEQQKMLGAAFGSGAQQFAGAATAFMGPALLMVQAADLFLDAAKMLIGLIPGLLNKIAEVITGMLELPLKIAESLQKVFDSVINFVKGFVSNLLSSVGNIISSFADFLTNFSDAIVGIIDSIPDAVLKLFERLPEIAFRLGEGIMETMVLFAFRLPAAFIKAAPKIGKAIMVGMFELVPAMAVEMVEGMVLAFKAAANELSNALGLGDIFNIPKLEEEIQRIGDNIQRAASNLFQVLDLEAAARGLDMADRIRNAIDSATTRAGNILQHWWNVLVSVWRQIWDTVFKPFVDFLVDAWKMIYDTIIKPLLDGLMTIWNWVSTYIINPLISGLQTVWNFVVDNILKPLGSGLQAIWDFVYTSIIKPLTDGFGWVSSLVSSISSLFTTPSWLSSLSIPTPGWLSSLSIPTPGWLKDFTNAVNKLTSFGGFSMGGLVKGISKTASNVVSVSNGNVNVGGDNGISIGSSGTSIGGHRVFSHGGMAFNKGGHVPMGSWRNGRLYAAMGSVAQGTDVVPAVLTPGEFVVNREATRNNLGLLSLINSAKAPVSPVVGQTSISVVINATTELTPAQIRREIIPELERELKRKSQEGAFIMATSGIRTNK